ncbi:hypothetical protein ACWLMY_35750 [Streptomyces anulatus]
MTLAHLPAPAGPPDDAPSYEPREGEPEALAEAAAAGRRAAAWVRSLPGPPAPGPAGTWLSKELPAAIETAMGSLDPEDCTHLGPDGRIVYGAGGVDVAIMETLVYVPCVLPELDWLTPDQQVRLLAVASIVTGAVRLLSDAPDSATLHGLRTRLCVVLVLCHRTLTSCHRKLSGELPTDRPLGTQYRMSSWLGVTRPARLDLLPMRSRWVTTPCYGGSNSGCTPSQTFHRSSRARSPM